MPFFGIGKKDLSIEELQEKDEKASIELSLAQKQAAIKRLKEAGLTPKSFGGNWSAILRWLRTH